MKKSLSLAAASMTLFALAATAQAQIDVVFEIDESGSMSSAIQGVKNNVKTIYDALPTGSHVGLVGYGTSSHCGGGGQIPHIHTSLTTDQTVFYNAVDDMIASGGLEQGYRAVYEVSTDTVAYAWDGSTCTSNPSLGFTPNAPYCNILITDERLDQGGRTQQEAIDAMKAKNGHFFGILSSSLHAGTQRLADETGGKLFDLRAFLNDPQPVIESVIEACVWATSLTVDDGLSGQCLPLSSQTITYTLDYGNPSKGSIEDVEINHTGGTWGGAEWSGDGGTYIGTLASEATGSTTVTLPLGQLTPNMTFSNTFTMSSSTSGVGDAVGEATTTVCTDPAPVAQCKNIQVSLDANGNATISSADIDNSSYDPNGDPISLSISKSTFTCSDVGVQNFITLTATDPSGQSDSCVAEVTIVDAEAPTIETQNITVQLDDTGNASITVSAVDGGTTDNCCIDSWNLSKSSFNCADVGQQEVTLTVTDCNGNSNSAPATVTVEDTLPPSIQVNDRETIIPPDAPISFTATATDNCPATSLEIKNYTCYGYTGNGKQHSKMQSCVVNVSGDTLTILDSGGVGDNIAWTVVATDQSGNTANAEGHVVVVNPSGKGKK